MLIPSWLQIPTFTFTLAFVVAFKVFRLSAQTKAFIKAPYGRARRVQDKRLGYGQSGTFVSNVGVMRIDSLGLWRLSVNVMISEIISYYFVVSSEICSQYS